MLCVTVCRTVSDEQNSFLVLPVDGGFLLQASFLEGKKADWDAAILIFSVV